MIKKYSWIILCILLGLGLVIYFNSEHFAVRPGMETTVVNVKSKSVSLNGIPKENIFNPVDKSRVAKETEVKVSASAQAVKEDKPSGTAKVSQPVYQSNNNYNSENIPVSRGQISTDINKYPKSSKVNGIFGQFHYRESGGGRIEVDPQWVADNIITITLPGLNRKVQVHKLAADNFIMAFDYIKNGTAEINGKQVSLLSLIETMDGTYVTRHVNWNPDKGLSNHSWGTAIDINARDHFRYVDSASDPNLILWEKAFKPAGFSWVIVTMIPCIMS